MGTLFMEDKVSDLVFSCQDDLRYIVDIANEASRFVCEEMDNLGRVRSFQMRVTDLRYRVSQLDHEMALLKGDIQPVPKGEPNESLVQNEDTVERY